MGLDKLQESLGYSFKDTQLIEQALTHPSCAQEQSIEATKTYQRLEFLGDAVLDLVLAEHLFHLYPDEREGFLARGRAALVKRDTLSTLASRLNINEHVRMSKLEKASGGQERSSILEDVFEALIGAVYLDSDLDTTRQLILNWYGDLQPMLEEILAEDNPKGRLQEHFQQQLRQNAIEYIVKKESGPSHNKEFLIEVYVAGKCLGEGSGHSKKEAEEAAARIALETLESEPLEAEE
tara:strand:- start:8345 stop:9055 length:711 start_codon:yes stop_codon:yes gene_type:complete